MLPSRIELQIYTPHPHAAPGQTVELLGRLTNRGDVVEAFSLSMSGLDPGWFTLPDQDVGLFPGDSFDVVIPLHPPEENAQAGDYTFNLVVGARDNPLDQNSTPVRLTIEAGGDIKLGLEPARVRGRRGVYSLSLTSTSNAPHHVVLAATDPEEAFHYIFGSPLDMEEQGQRARTPEVKSVMAQASGCIEHEIDIPPGASLLIPLAVKPRKRAWVGPEQLYTFQVGRHPAGVEWVPDYSNTQVVRGELVCRAVVPLRVRIPARALYALLALGMLLAAIAALSTLAGPGVGNRPLGSTSGKETPGTTSGSTGSGGTGSGGAGGKVTPGTSQNTQGVGTPGSGAGGSQGGQGNQGGQAEASGLFENRFWLVVPGRGNEAPPDSQVSVEPNVQWNITSAQDVLITHTMRPFDAGGFENSSLLDYYLTASSNRREVTSTLSVLLLYPPGISFFKGSPLVINQGQSALLEWEVRGSRATTIDSSPADSSPADTGSGGGGHISVTPGDTHHYVFCAENSAGRVCRSVEITVLPGPTQIPAISVPPSLTPSPTLKKPTSTPVPATLTPRRTATATPTRPSLPATATRTTVVTSTRTATLVPPSATKTPTLTPSSTAQPTYTYTVLPTLTSTVTITVSRTATITTTSTTTRTVTVTRTVTYTVTRTATSTVTSTYTVTPTRTVYVPQCSQWDSADVVRKTLNTRTIRSILDVPRSGTIDSVMLTNLTLNLGTNNQAVSAYLISPSGQRVDFYLSCPGASVTQVILDDAAESRLPTCGNVANGSYKPNGQLPLSTFAGSQAQGTWTLLLDVSIATPVPPTPTAFNNPTPTATVTPQPAYGQLRSWGLRICYRP